MLLANVEIVHRITGLLFECRRTYVPIDSAVVDASDDVVLSLLPKARTPFHEHHFRIAIPAYALGKQFVRVILPYAWY